MAQYRNIKVPEWAYENCRRAETELMRRGLNALPSEVLEPSVCPVCQNELMSQVEVRYHYATCTNCGYRQQAFGVASSAPAFGAVIGIAALLLIYLLSQRN